MMGASAASTLARRGAWILILQASALAIGLIVLAQQVGSHTADFVRARTAERLRGEILLHDETLTMSTWMFVSTGDRRWMDRYPPAFEALEASLAEAETLVGGAASAPLGRLRDANLALLELERRAFALAENGSAQEAAALLDSTGYAHQKALYSSALSEFAATLHAEGDGAERAARSLTRWLALTVAACIAISGVAIGSYARAGDIARRAVQDATAAAAAASAETHFAVDVSGMGLLYVHADTVRFGDGACALLGLDHSVTMLDREAFLAQFEPGGAGPLNRLFGHVQDSVDEALVQTCSGRWLLARGRCKDEGGGARFTGALFDVSRRVQTEQQIAEFAAVLEARVEERTAQLAASAAQTRTLARRLGEVEQEERRRLSALLHEDLQQLLAATRLRVSAGMPAGDIVSLLDEAIASTRALAHSVAPPLPGLPIDEMLGLLVRDAERRLHLSTSLTVTGRPRDIPGPIRNELYVATRELLFNAHKHGGQGSTQLTLDLSEEWNTLTIANPLRLDTALVFQPGHGLRTIRARVEASGGTVTALSDHASGEFVVTLRLPAV